MNIKAKQLFAFVMITVLLLSAGCADNKTENKFKYAALHGLVGKSVDEACQTLELDQAGVTAAINSKLPYTVTTGLEYAGLSWDVQLLMDDLGVYGFQYSKDYGQDTALAAQDFKALAERLTKNYGSASTTQGTIYGNLSVELIQSLIQRAQNSLLGMVYIHDTWKLNSEITEDMQTSFDNRAARLPNSSHRQIAYEMMLFCKNENGSVSLELKYSMNV